MTGNKVNNIDVVYTPWSNLKKTASMDVGQVGFHSSKMVRWFCFLLLVHIWFSVSDFELSVGFVHHYVGQNCESGEAD